MRDKAVYLIVFKTLTELNMVKRKCGEIHFQMQHAPASIARGGCSFALKVTGENLERLCETARQAVGDFYVYRVEKLDNKTTYNLLDKGGPCDIPEQRGNVVAQA